jgi:hypothetical protein
MLSGRFTLVWFTLACCMQSTLPVHTRLLLQQSLGVALGNSPQVCKQGLLHVK